jgi:hypothetical protein
MMDEEKSTTTDENNQDTDSQVTDQQTDSQVDNLDDTSKSTEQSADEDKKSETESEDSAPTSKFDTDIDEWAETTKRPKPTTDEERTLLQEIRDGQREFSRSKQAKDSQKEVDTAIKNAKPADNKQDDEEDDDSDPLERRQNELEAKLAESESIRLRSEYFSQESVTEKEAGVMGEILKEKVDKGGQEAYDHWTDPANLDDWHMLAKARLSTNKDTTVIEEEAARKERERIAKESQANGGARNAQSTETGQPKGYDRNAYLKSDDY